MNRDSAFFTRSIKVAQGFLQTAVVVDDRAFLEEPEPKPTGSLAQPATPSTIAPRAEETAISAVAATPQQALAFAPEAHRLDAQPVIDGFARRGIVCAVLKRDPNDVLANPTSRLSQLAGVADIMVLDWHVHTGGGESAQETLELLETVVTRNRDETPRQLRLMVVYTGEIHLLKVAEQIRARLESKLGAVQPDGEFAFTQGAVRIVVLGKKTIAGRTPEAKAQEADFDELAGRTISEFAAMTAGLVSNVMLDALARLRCATHRILGRFPPSLDAAFLVHRALLDPPQEADEHLAPIIAAELLAVIEDVAEPLPSGMVAEWLATRVSTAPTHLVSGFPTAEAEREWLYQLCESGHKEVVKGALPGALEWLREINTGHGCVQLDQLTTLIGGGALPGANEELAMLMAVKTKYSGEPPRLTLGTIVLQEKENAKVFWLCLQPVCDSLRVPSARAFPMLRLSQSNDRFGVVALVDGAFVRLRIDPRPFKLRTVEFKPDKDAQAVIAKSDENQRYWFESKDPAFRCRWIAELKFEQAQRAVQAFASQNSRVGLTESEWQRRWDRQRSDS